MPDQQVQDGLAGGGQLGGSAVDVGEPGVVVARGPGGDELVDAGGVRGVALSGQPRVLEEGALGVEQVEPTVAALHERGDPVLVEARLLDQVEAAIRPAAGTGLVEPRHPGRDRVQDAVQRGERRRDGDRDLFDLVCAQQEFAQTDLGRVGAAVVREVVALVPARDPADGDPGFVEEVVGGWCGWCRRCGFCRQHGRYGRCG